MQEFTLQTNHTIYSANTKKDYVSEFKIFRILDSLRPTATGHIVTQRCNY